MYMKLCLWDPTSEPGLAWLWSVGMFHLANDMSLTGHMLKKLEVKQMTVPSFV